MGGKLSSTYKHKSFNWTKPRKKRSILFTKFLIVLLYTRSHDLIPNSILLEDIPFPTDADNWSMQEYNIWSSLLNVLEIRSSNSLINKIELKGKKYVEMKFVNEIYDGGFNMLIDCLRNDDYYWKKSQNILGGNIITRRSLSPISFYSDYSLDVLDNHNVSDIVVPFEKVEELLIRFRLQKEKYGIITRKDKNKKSIKDNDVLIWKVSNRNSGISGISGISGDSEISVLKF